MSDFNGFFDSDWSDLDDLEWNEFHWERYLRDQDEAPLRYLALYESLLKKSNRLDESARLMGWGIWNRQSPTNPSSLGTSPNREEDGEAQDDDDTAVATAAAAGAPSAKPPQAREPAPRAGDAPETEFSLDEIDAESGVYYEVYTPQRNPLFIATRGLYLRLRRTWELLAATPSKHISAEFAVRYLATLHDGETQALQAIQALDCCEHTLAVSLFKRALVALNASHALLNKAETPAARRYAEEMRVTLFDLREIWLHVISECRHEAQRWLEDEDDED